MSDMEKEERIRVRAHEIWERNGRREGQSEEDWDQARVEIEREDADAARLKSSATAETGLAEESEADISGVGTDDLQSTEPAEGDRKVIERQLSRKRKKT